jgi:hypothetical protein
MNMTNTHTNHTLEAHASLALRDAGGRTIRCVSGSVWLTMEGDLRDVVLAAGESFVVDRDGVTILAAQKRSVVEVSAANQPRTWWERVVDYLDKTYGPGAIRPSRKQYYYNERNRHAVHTDKNQR